MHQFQAVSGEKTLFCTLHLAHDPNALPRTMAQGFYALLEQETAAAGSDAEAFHAMVNGQGDVWQYYTKHFAEPYALVPGLEPLPAVYSRPDQSASSTANNDEQSKLPSSSGGRTRMRKCLKGKPQLIASGVSEALGYRKSCVADVRVVGPGQGRIMINDQVRVSSRQMPISCHC